MEDGSPAVGGSDAPLSVRGLGFRYPGRRDQVLREITFDVGRGDVVGILGPNGSGKSTLLAAIVDMRGGVRSGEALFFGKLDFPRRLVGFATQQIALYQQLTVRENLFHAARLLVPRRGVGLAVETCVDEYGLSGVVRKPVHQLSGGWQRLAHIAASFVHDPPMRFLDEPTNALDFEARARLIELVGGWRSRSIATVMTSHYPEDIEEMCQRIVVIREGRAVRSGKLADMLLGLSRQLVVEGLEDGAVVSGRANAPSRLGDLAGTVDTLLQKCRSHDADLVSVRLTSATLRGLLTEDPQLRGVLSDAG